MTFRERMLAAWSGRPSDHVPLTTWCFGLQAPPHLRWERDGRQVTYWYSKRMEHIHTLPQAWTLQDDFARVLALKNGIKETNTLSRLRVLSVERVITEELWSTAVEAYEMQMQLRLIHQLHQIEAGIMPDNYIDPAGLSDLEKRMLRDSFEVIERMHSFLKTIFPVA